MYRHRYSLPLVGSDAWREVVQVTLGEIITRLDMARRLLLAAVVP